MLPRINETNYGVSVPIEYRMVHFLVDAVTAAHGARPKERSKSLVNRFGYKDQLGKFCDIAALEFDGYDVTKISIDDAKAYAHPGVAQIQTGFIRRVLDLVADDYYWGGKSASWSYITERGKQVAKEIVQSYGLSQAAQVIGVAWLV